MLPLWKIQPRPTARSKKKFTAPKAEILQKNAETENLQKSAKTAQKAAPAKKAEYPMLTLTAMSQEGQDPKKGYCPEGWDLRKECRGQ